jgi:hypothetical protein
MEMGLGKPGPVNKVQTDRATKTTHQKRPQARNDEVFQAIATAQASRIQIGISTTYPVG